MVAEAQALLDESNQVVRRFPGRVTRRLEDRTRRAIFFGSRARGRAKPGSDYDLLVVVRERDPDLGDQPYDEALDCLLTFGHEVSLKVYTEEGFERGLSRRIPFLCSVAETAVELWNAPMKRCSGVRWTGERRSFGPRDPSWRSASSAH